MTLSIPTISSAVDAVLEPSGPREGFDKGNPQTSLQILQDADGVEVGIWECTPGGWQILNRVDTETIMIVSGKAVLTNADGSAVDLVAGVVVVMPKGWSGRWDVIETVRKVYILAS